MNNKKHCEQYVAHERTMFYTDETVMEKVANMKKMAMHMIAEAFKFLQAADKIFFVKDEIEVLNKWISMNGSEFFSWNSKGTNMTDMIEFNEFEMSFKYMYCGQEALANGYKTKYNVSFKYYGMDLDLVVYVRTRLGIAGYDVTCSEILKERA